MSDIIGTKPTPDHGPLFSVEQQSVERVTQAHAELRKKHEAKISHLAPQLKDLAFRRGDYGVDASDTRSLALKAGLVTGSEKELRALSWFACVPRRAGLIAAGPRTEWNPQGNRHTRYLQPTFCTAEQLERASRKRTRRAA